MHTCSVIRQQELVIWAHLNIWGQKYKKYSEVHGYLLSTKTISYILRKIRIVSIGKGENKIQGVVKQDQKNCPFSSEYGELYGLMNSRHSIISVITTLAMLSIFALESTFTKLYQKNLQFMAYNSCSINICCIH